MPSYPKRLIEVDLPIARISAHARREKSIRHGHISTLHIWWARRPLAACRAVICAALWPDPADPLCPTVFREKAIEALQAFAARVFPPRVTAEEQTLKRTASVESLGRWEALAAGTLTLDANVPGDLPIVRLALLDFIADFANWDNSTVPAYLETSRALTQAAHEALGGEPGTRPLVVDPFAGGGSIPLEALRVGADAFASDLNPVAVLLNKVVLEYIPKYGNAEIEMKDAAGRDVTFHGLAEAVRYWGNWVKEQAEKELAEFYPKDPDGSTPVAYLWARTALCEGPRCGCKIPLIRNLSPSQRGNGTSLELVESADGQIRVQVVQARKSPTQPTVSGGKAVCPRTQCGFVTPAKNVRRQLAQRAGGGNDARLLAICSESPNGRRFREVTHGDLEAIGRARIRLTESRPDLAPQDEINPTRPFANTRGLSAVTRIGITRFEHLYNCRQSLSLQTFLGLICNAPIESTDEHAGIAIRLCLSCIGSRLIFQNTTLSRWHAKRETIEGAFGKQALQNTWDFVESNPIAGGGASWFGGIEWVVKVIDANLALAGGATVHQSAAQAIIVPDDSADAAITDPPYFASIPYGDLSDVFYVWERTFIRKFFPAMYVAGLTQKFDEAIVTNANVDRSGAPKSPDFYKRQMTIALSNLARAVRPSGIGLIVFADSRTDSWEAILGAVINSNWCITASWPIDTELQTRTQASHSASLQSSVHLVCRPREDHDGVVSDVVGEWRGVLGELPKRIHEWMPRLAGEGVVGADAIFACLGPALEIFSRYSRVEKSNGEPATLREYLEFVWAAVSTEALSLIFKDADAAGLEPDARLTAMWLWTVGGGGMTNGKPIVAKAGIAERPHPGPLPEGEGEDAEVEEEEDEQEQAPSAKGKSASGFTLEFDAARKIAQGLGVHLEQCESLVEVKGDKARLLSVAERTAYLFGKGTQAAGGSRKRRASQKSLFAALDDAQEADTGWGEIRGPAPGSTVLDRVHQAMVLFAANRGELLKRFLVADGVGKDARFWKLADNLNKLYPSGSDERRWVEGVLARKKGLGL